MLNNSLRCGQTDEIVGSNGAEMAKNERKTENIVRDLLRDQGFYDEASDIQIEEQKSNIETVKKLLKSSSKSGGGGGGAPEFIISAPSTPDFLIVIECKASVADHVSGLIAKVLAGMDLAEDAASYGKRVQRFGDHIREKARWNR